MNLPREDLKRFVGNCDPKRALSGTDPRYVPLDEVRGGDGPTCVDLLEQMVVLSDESCQLFTGFPGTGKTTELLQLEQRLNNASDLPTHVVYVDFDEYIDIFSPVSITDILRVIAYCLDREATRMEGGDPDQKLGYLERFIGFLSQTEIGMSRKELSAYGVKIMLELKNNPDFYRRAEAALSQRFQQFVEDARQSMIKSVGRLKSAQGSHAQRVVVIADGLEKIGPRREEERGTVEESIEMLFSTHARLLRLPCHVIYTFPLWLRYRRADLGASYDGEPLALPMVKVTDRDGSPVERGIERLVELISRRVELERVFGPDPSSLLRPMILASGGYPRDLLRLVRNLLTGSRTFPARPEDAERVIERLAQDYGMTLYGTELDVLLHVANKHELPRDSSEELVKFVRLLDRWLVLAYRNGKEWYDVHPMARRDPRVAERLKK